MNSLSYHPLQKRPSISKFFDGAVTHVKSALQFPLTTVTAIAEKEMSSKRDKSPAKQKLTRKEARSETPLSSNSRNISFIPLKHKLTRREARSETTHSSNDRNLTVTPAQINLYPIDGSPEDRAVESDMIDIGFYASIGYPVNRSLAMDGGADTPLDTGNMATPRHKLQNRNATVMPTPPMSEGIGPRHMLVTGDCVGSVSLTNATVESHLARATRHQRSRTMQAQALNPTILRGTSHSSLPTRRTSHRCQLCRRQAVLMTMSLSLLVRMTR